MSSLADIRVGLANNLRAAGFENVQEYTMASPSPPCFEIDLAPDGAEFDLAFARGLDQVTMVVRAIVADTSDIGSQVTLDTYLDGSSSFDVYTALMAEPTLGSSAQGIHVTQAQMRRWRSDTSGGLLVGMEWLVTVYPTGNS